MAFQNIIFPTLRLKHGITKQVTDPVTITGNGTREVRRRQNRHPRFMWTIPSRNLVETDKWNLYQFLSSVNYGLDSFLYQDPDYPFFDKVQLYPRSGSTYYLRLPANATDKRNSPLNWTPYGNHPVWNINNPNLFTVQQRTGATTEATRTITAVGKDSGGSYLTVSGVSGNELYLSGPCYMTVRFEGTLSWTITAMEKINNGGTCDVVPMVSSIGDFGLVEVFE